MTTHEPGRNIHWGYFLALEEDLIEISRFIEFCPKNNATFSVELSKLFLSASSEVDVVMKLLCKEIDKSFTKARPNIDDYREILMRKFPGFAQSVVILKEYRRHVRPWEAWFDDKNPDWWHSYNNVKHQRTKNFKDANLKNTIDSMGALMLTIHKYYEEICSQEMDIYFDSVEFYLTPRPRLMATYNEYYGQLVVNDEDEDLIS